MYNLIEKGKTSNIYFLLFLEPCTKYNIIKELSLRNNEVYDENKSFHKLLTQKYIKKTGLSDRKQPVYKSTSKPIIEKIESKLKENNQKLTSFEKWILETILESNFFQKIINQNISIDYKHNSINSYDIIFENYLSIFLLSAYVSKNVFQDPEKELYEPNNDKNKFLDIWEDKKELFPSEEKSVLKSYLLILKEKNITFSNFIIPETHTKLFIEKMKKNSTTIDFFTRWVCIPNSLLHKLIPISSRSLNYLDLLNNILFPMIQLVTFGLQYPKLIQNPTLRNFIKDNKHKAFSMMKRHPEFALFK